MDVTATLPVRAMPETIDFYTAAGFDVSPYVDGDYAFVAFGDRSVFDLGVEDVDPATNRAGCYLRVEDPDAWHARLDGLGYDVTDVAVQPWGMREFTLTDPGGNRLRFGRSA